MRGDDGRLSFPLTYRAMGQEFTVRSAGALIRRLQQYEGLRAEASELMADLEDAENEIDLLRVESALLKGKSLQHPHTKKEQQCPQK